MEWNTLAYTRAFDHDGQRLIRDHRTRPVKIHWSRHALWRAWERAGLSPEHAAQWFQQAVYLGRWAREEGWGDRDYVVMGIRDKGQRGLLTITTFMPRAYWNYDVERYDRKMNELAGLYPAGSETYGQKNNIRPAKRRAALGTGRAGSGHRKPLHGAQ